MNTHAYFVGLSQHPIGVSLTTINELQGCSSATHVKTFVKTVVDSSYDNTCSPVLDAEQVKKAEDLNPLDRKVAFLILSEHFRERDFFGHAWDFLNRSIAITQSGNGDWERSQRLGGKESLNSACLNYYIDGSNSISRLNYPTNNGDKFLLALQKYDNLLNVFSAFDNKAPNFLFSIHKNQIYIKEAFDEFINFLDRDPNKEIAYDFLRCFRYFGNFLTRYYLTHLSDYFCKTVISYITPKQHLNICESVANFSPAEIYKYNLSWTYYYLSKRARTDGDLSEFAKYLINTAKTAGISLDSPHMGKDLSPLEAVIFREYARLLISHYKIDEARIILDTCGQQLWHYIENNFIDNQKFTHSDSINYQQYFDIWEEFCALHVQVEHILGEYKLSNELIDFYQNKISKFQNKICSNNKSRTISTLEFYHAINDVRLFKFDDVFASKLDNDFKRSENFIEQSNLKRREARLHLYLSTFNLNSQIDLATECLQDSTWSLSKPVVDFKKSALPSFWNGKEIDRIFLFGSFIPNYEEIDKNSIPSLNNGESSYLVNCILYTIANNECLMGLSNYQKGDYKKAWNHFINANSISRHGHLFKTELTSNLSSGILALSEGKIELGEEFLWSSYKLTQKYNQFLRDNDDKCNFQISFFSKYLFNEISAAFPFRFEFETILTAFAHDLEYLIRDYKTNKEREEWRITLHKFLFGTESNDGYLCYHNKQFCSSEYLDIKRRFKEIITISKPTKRFIDLFTFIEKCVQAEAFNMSASQKEFFESLYNDFIGCQQSKDEIKVSEVILVTNNETANFVEAKIIDRDTIVNIPNNLFLHHPTKGNYYRWDLFYDKNSSYIRSKVGWMPLMPKDYK